MRQRSFLHFGLVSSLVLATFLAPVTAWSQPVLRVAPPMVGLTVDDGEQPLASLTVTNDGSEPLVLTISRSRLPDQNEVPSAYDWLPNESIIASVPAGGHKEVLVPMRIPKDTSGGVYAAAVLITQVADKGSDPQGVLINAVPAIGVPLLITYKREVRVPVVTVDPLHIAWRSDTGVALAIHNPAGQFAPRQVRVQEGDTTLIQEAGSYFMPDSSQKYTLSFPRPSFAEKRLLTIVVNGKETKVALWIVNGLPLGGGFALLVLLGLCFAAIRRRVSR